jgi:hypothetical protein
VEVQTVDGKLGNYQLRKTFNCMMDGLTSILMRCAISCAYGEELRILMAFIVLLSTLVQNA